MIRRFLRPLPLLATFVGGSSAYFYQADARESFLKRQAKFWYVVAPIIMDYRQLDKQTNNMSAEEQQKRYNELHDKYAPQIRDLFLDLRGIFVKMGQVGASRSDISPPAYREAFQVFLDQVPSQEGQTARDMAEQALGRKLDDVFDEFDDKPLGAASVGQVHAARLKTGEEVVVKVQYPEVHRMFKVDVSSVAFIVNLQFPEQKAMMEEMQRQVEYELQFDREAWALGKVRDSLKDMKEVRVPAPVQHLCTPTCVVMERFYGLPLTHALKQNALTYTKMLGFTTPEQMKQSFTKDRTTFTQLMFHSKLALTYVKNYVVVRVIGLLQMMGIQGDGWQWQCRVNMFNLRQVYSTIVRAHGEQLFVAGLFNGDPHIGNIWILDSGQVGLIDFGQVKQLTPDQQADVTHLYRCMRSGDKEEAVKKLVDMGYRSQSMDPEKTWQRLLLYMDRDDHLPSGMHVHKYMKELQKDDGMLAYPEHLLLLCRMVALLRGVGYMIMPGQKQVMSSYWAEYLQA